MNRETEILVIGGGPAGITFSLTAKKLAPDVHVTMSRPESRSVVYCAIPYAIEGLFGPEKVLKEDKMVTGAGVELVHKKVVNVDLRKRLAVTEDGETCRFHRLFIATGASPATPRTSPGTTEVRVKIVADLATDRVIGGQVVAWVPTTDKVDVISLAIQQKLTVRQLACLNYSAQPWQSFLPARNPIVEACENALMGKTNQAAA